MVASAIEKDNSVYQERTETVNYCARCTHTVAYNLHLLPVSIERRALPYWSSYSRPRLAFHTITSSKYFDLAIAAVIGINVVTMAMEYHMMPEVPTVGEKSGFWEF